MRGTILRVAGAGLLAASAGIHLDLYLTGYRTIPTIGWLFLLQVIAGFALALAVLLAPRRLRSAAALAAAGFAIATFGGYLLSVWVGLFGFREVRTTAGIVAGILEIAAFGVLVWLAAADLPADLAALPIAAKVTRRESPAPFGIAMGVVCVAALAVLAGTEATAANGAPASTSASTVLKTARIGGATVLTNGHGFTLYTFAPDGPAHSVCYGSCAAYWPPVTGSPVPSPGLTGTFATTRRTDGTLQITYDGHPLYTYVGDSSPGQASGNGLNLNGGLWRDVTVG